MHGQVVIFLINFCPNSYAAVHCKCTICCLALVCFLNSIQLWFIISAAQANLCSVGLTSLLLCVLSLDVLWAMGDAMLQVSIVISGQSVIMSILWGKYDPLLARSFAGSICELFVGYRYGQDKFKN